MEPVRACRVHSRHHLAAEHPVFRVKLAGLNGWRHHCVWQSAECAGPGAFFICFNRNNPCNPQKNILSACRSENSSSQPGFLS
jgi:hypothetical protein